MKNKTSIYLYVLVLVLLLFVSGATYAFFAGDTNINAQANLAAETGSTYSFTSTSATDFAIDVTTADMQQSSSGNYVSSSIGTINVSLTSPVGKPTYCTYDLLFTWTSSDKYKTPNVELPYIHTDGTKYNYEFSTIVKDSETGNIEFSERDLSKVTRETGFGDSVSGTIAEDLLIESNGVTVSKTYEIEARIYNLPVEQQKLVGKNMKASIKVTNVDCQYEGDEEIDVSTLSNFSTSGSNSVINLVSNQGVDVANVDSIYFVDYRRTKVGNVENIALFKGMDNNVIKAWTNGNNLYIGSSGTVKLGPMMRSAFQGSSTLNVIDMNNADTSYVTRMDNMFQMAGSSNPDFTLNLGSSFNTMNVTDMAYMFHHTGRTNVSFTLDLGDLFDTRRVKNMQYMFANTGYNSKNFSLDLGSKFNTKVVNNMVNMFSGTGYRSSWTLNLRSFNFNGVGNHRNFFTDRPSSSMLIVLAAGPNREFLNLKVTNVTGHRLG